MSRQLVAFVAVALAGAVVQLVGLWAGSRVLGLPDVLAFWLGWLAGWAHNFAWHRARVFPRAERDRAQRPRSLVAALSGLAVQTVVFTALKGPLPLLLAGACAAACSLPVTFLLSRQWAFREPRAT